MKESNYISREIKNGITQELLKDLFEYKDGKLFYKRSTARRIKIGDRVGFINKETGYRRTGINNKTYQEHRIIFLFHKGYLQEFIDHKDESKINNKIENLREATKSQNSMNTTLRNDNSSGTKGLLFMPDRNKCWYCRLWLDGTKILDKSFYDKEEAITALNKARLSHGIFANNGNKNLEKII